MWRKRLRLGIAVFGIGLAAFVVSVTRPRESRPAPPPVARLDPSATVETRGCEVVQLRGAKQDLRVECASQVTYQDGRTALVGVTLRVDNRAGRNFEVRSQEASVGARQSSFDMKGDVRLEASDGLVATAESASYVADEGIVRAPGPVQFSRERMAGTGIGFTYDEQRNTLWLLDQAVVRLAADGAAGAMDIAAGTAGFARAERYLRFERGVRMTRSGQVIEADEATVFLFADRDEPDRIELRGNARITGGEGMGALRLMRARDINLDYGDDGRTLQQATLAGQSAVELGAPGQEGGQQLSSEYMDVVMAADGGVESLVSRNRVVVTLPARAAEPGRTIRAQSLTGSGAGGQGLTAMHFDEGVTFTEAASGDGGVRTARSRTLDVRMAAADGSLDEARFTGSFSFAEGALRAQSGEARYQTATGTLNLRGRDDMAAPFVRDDALRIDGDAIDVTLSPRRMVAKGTVRSVLQPTSAPSGGAPAARRPSLLGGADPVNVIADELAYDERARKGEYTGGARLWQGDTVIQADAIAIDETRGDLTASGRVITTLSLVSEHGPTAAAPAPPTILRAHTFTYGDQTRRAVYDTGAQMNGEQGDLRADRIELTLAAGENRLDRLDARGAVQVGLDKRQASGATLVYRPADGRYEITGAPGRFIDECNESAGRTLTFFRSSDRVIIDGNEEVRTETRGGRCPGRTPS